MRGFTHPGRRPGGYSGECRRNPGDAWSLVIVLAGLVTSGCGHTAPLADPSAGVPVTAPESASMPTLDGRWVFGTGDEPGAGAVSGCAPSNSIEWAQEGTFVQARVQTCQDNCYVEETLKGSANANGTVALTGFAAPAPGVGGAATPVSYNLSWDPATGHLRGVKDGQTIWAAPYQPASGAYCNATM